MTTRVRSRTLNTHVILLTFLLSRLSLHTFALSVRHLDELQTLSARYEEERRFRYIITFEGSHAKKCVYAYTLNIKNIDIRVVLLPDHQHRPQ